MNTVKRYATSTNKIYPECYIPALITIRNLPIYTFATSVQEY